MTKSDVLSLGISSFAWGSLQADSDRERTLFLKNCAELAARLPLGRWISSLEWHADADEDQSMAVLVIVGGGDFRVEVRFENTRAGGLTLLARVIGSITDNKLVAAAAFLEAYTSIIKNRLLMKPGDDWQTVPRSSEAMGTAGRILPDAILQRASEDRYKEKTAIRQGQESVTFGELAETINRFSAVIDAQLRAHPAAYEAVIVEGRNGYKLIAACCAANLCGFPFVCVDPDWPAERKALVLDQFKSALKIDPEIELECSQTGVCDESFTAARAWDVAYIIFTSGSTGVPKGVVVTHDSAINTIDDVVRRLDLSSSDIGLSIAPPGFDLWIFDVFGILGIGGTLLLLTEEEKLSPISWSWLCASYGVTFWNSVPAPFEAMLEQAPGTILSVRNVMWSGDWIPLSLPGRAREKLPNAVVWSFGGATEGSIWSIHYRIPNLIPSDWPSIPYGKALAHQEVSVRDREGLRITTAGVRGEICIGGRGVVEGYLNDPERTYERFVFVEGERLYKTGDMGEYLTDGNIRIIGRLDSQVKVNGYRVELGDIQTALETCPDVRSAVVIAPWADQPQTTRKLVACVVTTGDFQQDLLRRELADKLPRFMIPSIIVPYTSFPITPNGKVDRKALESEFYTNQLGVEWSHPTKPSSSIEWQVGHSDNWGRVIYDHCVKLWSVDHEFDESVDFYTLEGDSLRAVRLLGSLQQDSRVKSIDEAAVLEMLFSGESLSRLGDSEAIEWDS